MRTRVSLTLVGAFALALAGWTTLAGWTQERRGEGPGRRHAGEPPVSGRAGPGLEAFDALMLRTLRDHELVGGSLAVAKNGRLVLARGYGFADRRLGEPVHPDTLFSVASVTKPFTSAAVLRLVEDGKLSLDAHLMDVLSDLTPIGRPDPRARDVTVRQLLYHAGGWDAKVSGQPPHNLLREARRLGLHEPLPLPLCYRLMMGRPLDFAPGAESKYSNWGFMVLRLVIERASGQPYAEYVQRHVLHPMGVTRMRIELPEPGYAPDESRRYGPGGRRELPGGHSLDMGRHHGSGNWIASPTDLVRFLAALDSSRGRPFFKPEIVRQMLAAPPPPIKPRHDGSHPGLGWDRVRDGPRGLEFSKNGGKPGVMAWIEHLPDGIDWAVLFNTSKMEQDEGESNPGRELRHQVYAALRELQSWPSVDYFK